MVVRQVRGSWLETVVPGAEDKSAVRPDLLGEPLEAEQGPLLVVVELAGHDGDGDAYLTAGCLEVGPYSGVPVRIGIVGMRDPIAVVLQFLAEDGLVGLDLGPVEVEVIVILADRLSRNPGRTDYVLFGVVDDPSAHNVLAEKAGAEAGDVPVNAVMAQVHSLDLVRERIGHYPARKGGIRRPEDADVAAPGLSVKPLVKGYAVGALVDVGPVESARTALAATVLLDIADAAPRVLARQGIVVAAAPVHVRSPGHDDRMRALPLGEVDPRQEADGVAARNHFLEIGILPDHGSVQKGRIVCATALLGGGGAGGQDRAGQQEQEGSVSSGHSCSAVFFQR